uniref:Uncharacterized protein n=1 Tax=Arundo donax TaxID=35708 RepID=A0A0A9A7T8_ARUDO
MAMLQFLHFFLVLCFCCLVQLVMYL